MSAQNGPHCKIGLGVSRARETARNGKNRCPSVSRLGPGKRCIEMASALGIPLDWGWARPSLNHRCRRSLSPVNRRNLESTSNRCGGNAGCTHVQLTLAHVRTRRVWGTRFATSSPFCRRAGYNHLCVPCGGLFKVSCSRGGYWGRFDSCWRCRLPSVISEPSGAITL
jgi:hypothetical protein